MVVVMMVMFDNHATAMWRLLWRMWSVVVRVRRLLKEVNEIDRERERAHSLRLLVTRWSKKDGDWKSNSKLFLAPHHSCDIQSVGHLHT